MFELNNDNVIPLPKLSAKEIEQYLSSGLFHGIGKRTAELLVSHFGTETLNVLEYKPADELYQVPGLQRHRVATIRNAWVESQDNPVRTAIAWLLGRGITLGLTLKLTERYGTKTESVLKTNPYRIIDEVEGIGFKTADDLALTIGVPPNAQERYAQGVIHALKTALTEGHCFLSEPQLLMRSQELLTLPSSVPETALIKQAINVCLQQATLAESNSNGGIYLRKVYRAELSVALKVQDCLSGRQFPLSPLQDWLYKQDQYQEPYRLSDEQRSALLMAWGNPFGIITGGPGRGKTHILKYLVNWLDSQNFNIALAAPTGKAANRMRNATGHEAKTIHRLLQWQGRDQSFRYNQENPLPIDWLIVDEFSMVDLFLFNSLLKALLPTTRLLLVGDFNQLPSVGAGMVLRDLIVSERIPVTRLQTIYRQAYESPIIYAAEDVLMGTVPALDLFDQPSKWMDVGDCAMLIRDTPESVADAIVQLVIQMKADNIDLNEHLMILAPQKQGPAGVKALNARLQPIFNPPRPGLAEVKTAEISYRIGDRVIQLVNRYDTIPAVMNGESGWVIDLNSTLSEVVVEFEGGAIVPYLSRDFDQIMHSYALTCHKSQGSEFPYVIMPLVLSNRRMLTRQLLYTTMTRAAGTFIAVGEMEALSVAVASNKPAKRFTQLSNFLIETRGSLTAMVLSLRSPVPSPNHPPQKLTSIAGRVRERNLNCTKGQLTSIGSLALQLYKDQFGSNPVKQPEQLEGMNFKANTYHYGADAIALVDKAIDVVLNRVN